MNNSILHNIKFTGFDFKLQKFAEKDVIHLTTMTESNVNKHYIKILINM